MWTTFLMAVCPATITFLKWRRLECRATMNLGHQASFKAERRENFHDLSVNIDSVDHCVLIVVVSWWLGWNVERYIHVGLASCFTWVWEWCKKAKKEMLAVLTTPCSPDKYKLTFQSFEAWFVKVRSVCNFTAGRWHLSDVRLHKICWSANSNSIL